MQITQVGEINIQLNRKKIKNLHISVLPPDGHVRVSAPLAMTDTAIRMAVISRIPWIKKHQTHFAKQPRQSRREMVTGECHYFLGKPYRLNVLPSYGRHEIKLDKDKLHLYVNSNTTSQNKERVLFQYYRTELKNRIQELRVHWENIIGVTCDVYGIKKMKTRWGSCNAQSKRIWLNLELAKKPVECLEYVLVHELVHLLEKKHNARFKAYMDTFLSDWRERKNLLKSLVLAHDDWRC